MPARNTTVTKRKSKTVVKAPQPVKEKSVKEKPTISVTEDSSPEEILHSSWTFISVVQFFNTFHAYFHLSTIHIEKLERALLQNEEESSQDQDEENRLKRESSVLSTTSSNGTPQPQQHSNYFANFMAQILSPLLKSRQRSQTLDQRLSSLFPAYEGVAFNSLNIIDKIKILKGIQDLHMESNDEIFIALKNEKSPETLRIEPLGVDYQGWTYWYFGDTRLYREIPIPNGKRGTDMINSTDFTFQLVCSTVEEWHNIVKKFQPSNRTSCKELATKISEIGLEVIGKLEAREAARIRNEAKIKRAKELELIPKKRSRRLEAKFDEEAKRQKVLDIARQQAELEEIERKEKLKREKQLGEQEKQELRTEEARLRYDVHDFITQLISDGSVENSAKELRTQLHKRATEQDRLLRMQEWIKLLKKDIKLGESEETVQFVGEDLDQALNNVLFKSTLRIYLMTLMKFSTEPTSAVYNKLEHVYKKLVLSKYQHLMEFSEGLNDALNNEPIQRRSVGLLRSVFFPQFNYKAEEAEVKVDDMDVDEAQTEQVQVDQETKAVDMDVDVVETTGEHVQDVETVQQTAVVAADDAPSTTSLIPDPTAAVNNYDATANPDTTNDPSKISDDIATAATSSSL